MAELEASIKSPLPELSTSRAAKLVFPEIDAIGVVAEFPLISKEARGVIVPSPKLPLFRSVILLVRPVSPPTDVWKVKAPAFKISIYLVEVALKTKLPDIEAVPEGAVVLPFPKTWKVLDAVAVPPIAKSSVILVGERTPEFLCQNPS